MKKNMFNVSKLVSLTTVSAMCLGLLVGCGGTEKKTKDGYASEIYLYNWSEYMTEDVKNAFEEEYGIKVVESTYESNDELLAKLLAGGNSGTYDVALPSNYYITTMLANDLLVPYDATKLEHYSNLDPAYLGLEYDEKNQYTVPYMGTLGVWIGNKKILDELGVEIHTMKDLTNPVLKNNIIMTDDSQQITEGGLMGAGIDPSSQDVANIDSAKEFIMSINDNIKSFSITVDARDAMARGEAALAYMYSGEALQAMMENPDLVVVMEEEPVSLSLDTFVILEGSKHIEEAKLFIDFCLRDDISAQLTNEYMFTCFNTAAVDHLDEELASNPLCVMGESIKENMFYNTSLDADFMAAQVDAITEIKASR